MWLDTVAKMVQGNKDVKFAGMSNFEEIATRNNGWGYVKVAIPNDLAQQLLNSKEYNGGLLLFSQQQFNEIEAANNSPEDESKQKIDEPVNIIDECTACEPDYETGNS